ncbi:MAG: T9SS type A sorting domain-containing protein [Rhizobacter sp.]|nr:T9SS type A sorting domain-containing protein [Ferruginibacter sp.]
MKQIIFTLISALALNIAFAQDDVVSARVSQVSYSGTDPDGAGPATGTVTVRFEMMATMTVQADGFGIGFAFQNQSLMASPTPNITPLGPLASLGWTASPNLAGNPLGDVPYGGQTYNMSTIIGYSQAATGLTMPITTTWQPILQITYYTKGASYPQGGFITLQPGTTLAQHSISADGGFTEYKLMSPGFPAPLGLGGALPVLFSSFDAKCSGNGTSISWATTQESNSDYFEVQRSTDGNAWKTIGRTPAAGFSGGARAYNQIDLEAGNALYRIKQVDKDGQSVYTDIFRQNCQVKNISSVIYPVPAKDVLNVVIKSDRAVRTQLMVFEITGKLVKKLDANVQNGTNNFRIDLKGLTSGDYIIKSSDAGVELNRKFTIMN